MARKSGLSGISSDGIDRGGQRRSAFRAEFYRDRASVRPDTRSLKRPANGQGRLRNSMSVWLPVVGLSFMFCLLAVAGSSAMIWLRKLGALFGVEWAGDN